LGLVRAALKPLKSKLGKAAEREFPFRKKKNPPRLNL